MKKYCREVIAKPVAVSNYLKAKEEGMKVFEDRIGTRQFRIEVTAMTRKCRYYVRILEGEHLQMMVPRYEICPEDAARETFFEFMAYLQKRGE